MTPNLLTEAEAGSAVIVRFDDDGELSYHVCGEAVRLFIVDERAPNDRVYEWLPRCDASEISEIIPDETEIGSNQDERHQAIAHVVRSITEGKSHLSVVSDEEAGR